VSGGLTVDATLERFAAKLAFTGMRNLAHEFSRSREGKIVVAQTPIP
jgi:hypothetical protein